MGWTHRSRLGEWPQVTMKGLECRVNPSNQRKGKLTFRDCKVSKSLQDSIAVLCSRIRWLVSWASPLTWGRGVLEQLQLTPVLQRAEHDTNCQGHTFGCSYPCSVWMPISLCLGNIVSAPKLCRYFYMCQSLWHLRSCCLNLLSSCSNNVPH